MNTGDGAFYTGDGCGSSAADGKYFIVEITCTQQAPSTTDVADLCGTKTHPDNVSIEEWKREEEKITIKPGLDERTLYLDAAIPTFHVFVINMSAVIKKNQGGDIED